MIVGRQTISGEGLNGGRALVERFHENVEPHCRPSPARRFLGRQPGGYQPARARDVVEREDDVVEGEVHVVARTGDRRRAPLQRPAELIGERADGTALERRQAGHRLQKTRGEPAAQRVEWRLVLRHAVPRGAAIPHREDPERVGGEIGEAAERRMRHGAVEQAHVRQPDEARGRIDGVDPFELPNLHRAPLPAETPARR